jgi:hypothetical protein
MLRRSQKTHRVDLVVDCFPLISRIGHDRIGRLFSRRGGERDHPSFLPPASPRASSVFARLICRPYAGFAAEDGRLQVRRFLKRLARHQTGGS